MGIKRSVAPGCMRLPQLVFTKLDAGRSLYGGMGLSVPVIEPCFHANKYTGMKGPWLPPTLGPIQSSKYREPLHPTEVRSNRLSHTKLHCRHLGTWRICMRCAIPPEAQWSHRQMSRHCLLWVVQYKHLLLRR
jgi:hypothetical protein